jgi:hypothetical protein
MMFGCVVLTRSADEGQVRGAVNLRLRHAYHIQMKRLATSKLQITERNMSGERRQMPSVQLIRRDGKKLDVLHPT